ALHVKSWFQSEQSLERRIAARPFVHREDNLLSLWFGAIGSAETDRHGDNLVVELSGLNRRQRLLVAAQRELIRGLPGDAESLPHAFGRQPHRKIRVGIVVHQPWIRRYLVPAHRNHRHGFGSSG